MGGFHPDNISPALQYFQGDGETGLCLKMIKKGYKAYYNPKALIYHEVPADRMTIAYFDKRYFYQGVCNSYKMIRINRGIDPKVKVIDMIKNTFKSILKLLFYRRLNATNFKNALITEKEILEARFRAKERAGYEFHQEIAGKSPIVLEWILKENYFDYQLPKIND